MKKMGKWVLYIIVIILSYLIGGTLVQYSINHDFSSVFIKPTAADEKYLNIDLGWIKTSLPFSLQEDTQQASHVKKIANATLNAQAVQDAKVYTGTYDPKKFALTLGIVTYTPTSTLNPLGSFVGAIAGAGFEEEAKHAAQQAQAVQENGSIKYVYQAQSKLKNIPAVFGQVSCVKKNQLTTLYAVGRDTPQNKELIDHILTKTECFPQEK